MFSLPINGNTLKRSFLSGAGKLELAADETAWQSLISGGAPFTPATDKVADLRVGVNAGKRVRLGGSAFNLDFKGGFNAVNQIRLIWPGTDSLALNGIRLEDGDLPLDDGRLYVYLSLAAKGNASAKGNYKAPAGVSVNFGIAAGGAADFGFLKSVPSNLSARKVLTGLFAEMQLPQQVDETARIPGPGDVVLTRLGGYLNLSAGMTWGYEMNGSKSLDLRDLKLDLDYALKLAASVSVGYKLAGDFEVQARRGTADDWVRFIVRKSRHSEFSFAADLGATADLKLKGLPATADDFIIKLAGADAKSILDGITRARRLSTLEALEAELNALAMGVIDDIALKWMDKALDTSTADEFFAIAGKVVDQYNNLDNRIIQLYENYLGRIPKLRETLDALSNLQDPASLKSFLNVTNVRVNQEAWNIVSMVWSDGLFDLLSRQEEFNRFQGFIKETNDFLTMGVNQLIRDYIAAGKNALKLDPIFKALAKIDTPEELKALTDKKLRGMVEQLSGKAFDKLRTKKQFTSALKAVHDTLNKIEAFKNGWYAKLQDAATQNFNTSLSYQYSRATSRDALIDVELNLADPRGAKLAKAASRGDFSQILLAYRSEVVKVNRGVLSHNLTKSAQLKINLLGWSFDRLVTVVQDAEHSVEAQSGGLLHVYGTTSAIKQRKTSGRKFKETVASTFLLKTVAASFQPEDDPAAAIDPATKEYLARTLRSMSVDYDLSREDQRTTPEELTQYLRFAKFIGLIDDVAATVEEFKTQFPEGLGNVEIKYDVRYANAAVQSVFLRPRSDLEEHARRILRRFIAGKYTTMQRTSWMARVGFAYLAEGAFQAFERGDLMTTVNAVTLPKWFTRHSRQTVELNDIAKRQLQTLFLVEKSFVKRLGKLDRVIDKARNAGQAVSMDDLNKASRKFVGMADDVDAWRENAFFAVFDGLVHLDSGTKGLRASSMTIAIRPPGATQPVRKVLQAGSLPA